MEQRSLTKYKIVPKDSNTKELTKHIFSIDIINIKTAYNPTQGNLKQAIKQLMCILKVALDKHKEQVKWLCLWHHLCTTNK
jgi:hypothetical protein